MISARSIRAGEVANAVAVNRSTSKYCGRTVCSIVEISELAPA